MLRCRWVDGLRQSGGRLGAVKVQFVRDILAEDFNGDGRPDIFLSNPGTEAFQPFPGEQNRLFLSTLAGRYTDSSSTNIPQHSDFSHGSSIGDVDGDGDVDIVVNISETTNFVRVCSCSTTARVSFTEVANTGVNLRDICLQRHLPCGVLTKPICSTCTETAMLNIYAQFNQQGRTDLNRCLVNDGSGHFRFFKKKLPPFPNYPVNLVQDSFRCLSTRGKGRLPPNLGAFHRCIMSRDIKSVR
jgi:hypothetical protein